MAISELEINSKEPFNNPQTIESALIDINRRTIKLAYCLLAAFSLFTVSFLLILIIYLK